LPSLVFMFLVVLQPGLQASPSSSAQRAQGHCFSSNASPLPRSFHGITEGCLDFPPLSAGLSETLATSSFLGPERSRQKNSTASFHAALGMGNRGFGELLGAFFFIPICPSGSLAKGTREMSEESFRGSSRCSLLTDARSGEQVSLFLEIIPGTMSASPFSFGTKMVPPNGQAGVAFSGNIISFQRRPF